MNYDGAVGEGEVETLSADAQLRRYLDPRHLVAHQDDYGLVMIVAVPQPPLPPPPQHGLRWMCMYVLASVGEEERGGVWMEHETEAR